MCFIKLVCMNLECELYERVCMSMLHIFIDIYIYTWLIDLINEVYTSII